MAIAKLSDREGEGARPLLRSWSQGQSGGRRSVVVKITLGWNKIWLLLWKVVFRDRAEQAEGDTAGAGGEMGRHAGGDSPEVGTGSTAAVEAELANLEEGPQYYVCEIVGFRILWQALVSLKALRRVERNHRSVYTFFVGCVINTTESREGRLD